MGPGSCFSVIVTRSESGRGPLTTLLQARGARVVHWPTVRHESPEDPAPFHRALENIDAYDWIVFTSPRAVKAVIQQRFSPPKRIQVAAVGGATSEALAGVGWPTHLVPENGTGKSLVEAFERLHTSRGRVFFPASSIARPTVRQGLETLGFQVDQVVAYRTIEAGLDRQTCLTAVRENCPDIITFASPSAVEALHQVFGTSDFNRILAGTPAVAIGPVTAEALDNLGCPPVAIAQPHTLSGLADAVVETVDRLKN